MHWPTLFSIGLLPIIIYIYYRLSRREERMMIKEFGNEYIEYQKQVPMFIPNHAQWKDFIAQSKTSN